MVRSLYGLQEIGTSFDDMGRDLTSPEAFWAKYDQNEMEHIFKLIKAFDIRKNSFGFK